MPAPVDDEERISERLARAEHELGALRNALMTRVGFGDLNTVSKLPMKAVAIREALLWRSEELARCSIETLRRGDAVVGALTARATLEAAALMLRLHDLVRDRAKGTVQDLDSKLMQMLFGFRNEEAEAGERCFPEAISILTCINAMDRRLPRTRAIYDELSELAHPNWKGVAGLYSRIDHADFSTEFGRFAGDLPASRLTSTLGLYAAIETIQIAYNGLADMLPAFCAEADAIWPRDEPN